MSDDEAGCVIHRIHNPLTCGDAAGDSEFRVGGTSRAANVMVKNVERTGRGYRSQRKYKAASCSTTPPGWRRDYPGQPQAITRKIEDPSMDHRGS